MRRRIIYIDMSHLSLRNKERFMDFYYSHKGQPIETIVEVWNTMNPSKHIFTSIVEAKHAIR